ncbi:cytochrome b561 [Albimonas donghaensis]|uniref:Cytochrome b561 n=1 Tax=Albimonas donghaensis TaxID=356660 RepID=A0A1H2TEW8_9RHOB|nr:cytochrome b/b6 domain-containing protein [Albimonas donghaensis]MAS42189.1 cytochrome b [Paracoccaceae bacterium]MBR27153.1 cytochrome b [Paracoccaceae bacterium]SDW42225.1 cytochrome b561 [Albimonas donghaensis]
MKPASYPVPRKALHWLVALCVLLLVPIGLLIEGYEAGKIEAVNAVLGEGGFNLIYDLHKSLGITVLALMILRVAARAVWAAPAYARPLSPAERLVSSLVHAALYVLLIATPVVGWIGVSLYPAPVPVWGLFDAALPVAPDRAVSEFLLGGVHGPLGLLIGFLAVAHIAAALKHGLVDRDGVLGRMF